MKNCYFCAKNYSGLAEEAKSIASLKLFIKANPVAEKIWGTKAALLFLSTLLIVPIVQFMGDFYTKIILFAFLPVLPVLLFSIFSFEVTYILLIVTLFVSNPSIPYFGVPFFFTFVVITAFLISKREVNFKEMRHPLLKPLLLYIATMLPSLFNTSSVIGSLAGMLNMFAFISLIAMSVHSVSNYKTMGKFLAAYFLMLFLNGALVIKNSFESNLRNFGFASIMAVDYTALAIVFAFILVIYSSGAQRLKYLSILGYLMLVSITMATRSPWINTSLLLITMLIYMFFNSERLLLSRSSLSKYLALFVLLAIVGVFLVQSRGDTALGRVAKSTELSEEVLESGFIENSIVTRALIWYTALNAFKAHPIIGIGAYSFPFSSRDYSTLPKELYNKYVKYLSPHVGYYAVLTETGIVGLIGFLVFQFYILLNCLRSLRLAKTKEELKVTNVLAWGNIYIIICLFFTDAWLWAHGIILWGILVGLLMANHKMLVAKYGTTIGEYKNELEITDTTINELPVKV